MSQETFGRILLGTADDLGRAHARWQQQAVDWDLTNGHSPAPAHRQRTIARPVSVAGPGTFLGKATRTLRFEPTNEPGWWFSREDLGGDCLPVAGSIRNVWTIGDVVSNIVLRSGHPSNYIRMVEHVIALRLGLGIDNLMIRMESGDPPLFKRGSLDLIDALEGAGIVEQDLPVNYFTVKEKVSVVTPSGSFLILSPCRPGELVLNLDCAVDFPTAIGRQRIRFPLTLEHFKYGAEARTNTSFAKMLFCKTIGKLFADIRNLGYTMDNILVAGKSGYLNEARLVHDGKSLEAVWHRAVLDLVAALALVENGRFAGDVVSYCAGHGLDCHMVRLLYKHNLLQRVAPA
ncbi:MAG: UDP-3-O-acyl-N-acetylglucosamine deacetylase [bacterium]